MASTNVGVCEMPKQPGTFDTDLFPVQIDWMDGYAFAPDRPGLGVEIDEAVAESQGRQQLRLAARSQAERRRVHQLVNINSRNAPMLYWHRASAEENAIDDDRLRCDRSGVRPGRFQRHR